MGYRLGVKICGVTDEGDALQAAELGADWIGLNFYEGSPRYVTPEKAESIMRGLPAAAEPVGIFVLGESRMHLDFIPKFHLRTIQLHDEALDEASFIVRSCWPEIIKLGTYLQTHHVLTLPQVSRLLDLKNGQYIYNETTRPDMRYGA